MCVQRVQNRMVRRREGKDVDACTASKYEQLLMHGFLLR